MFRHMFAVLLLLALHAEVARAEPDRQQRVQAFAALPDWSGVWEIDNGTRRGLSGRSAGGAAELRAKSALAAPPPYNAKWEAQYKADVSNQPALAALAARSKSCTFGFPVIMESPRLFEIVITPEVTMIVFDDQEARRIYTDGKPHPAEEDLWPTRMGDSIGRWEGDTLVIETIARIPGPIGFAAPVAKLSEQARFTERIRLVNAQQLVNELTIEDPVAFVRPWRLTLRYKRVPGIDRVRSYDCSENDRNPVVDGKLTIAPP
jgi:hypothetical protein